MLEVRSERVNGGGVEGQKARWAQGNGNFTDLDKEAGAEAKEGFKSGSGLFHIIQCIDNRLEGVGRESRKPVKSGHGRPGGSTVDQRDSEDGQGAANRAEAKLQGHLGNC